MKNWGRFITAMVTPFDDTLHVDYDKAVELANKLINEGNTALVICGTTGEAPTLTRKEKMDLYKILKEKVNVPIIAGIGTNATSDTIENGKDAISCGVDGLLVVVPYYNKPDQESMYEHFKTVAEALDGDIMLYNVPGRTGINMLPSTVEKLAQIDNIVALKEASGNIVQFSEMVKKTPKDFMVYTGDDVLTLPSMAVGGYGVVSVAAHIVSSKMKEMIDSFLEGNVKKAAEIHLELLDINQNLFIVTNPIPVKAALNMMGLNVGGLRLPLTTAKPAVKAEIQKDMRKLGLV
ncbi:4-hydroxy-tetrahydrodipicolinate synthase [Marinisporobacter balticus]|uniref:4-hydroxy-tetrahydrodipicolinate synthase n=1 Tax=Marinisporobacter balticus TaxID=2018667 RepID=A0A4R2KL82_9FIRM|nr:4-hydroxy-tetrahydrodipicolinate synthase [Marinisporobacter balticus]TCO71459.1 4-hydroxy-tetrahydrodipicolinate synthase [Marinisporobacter balticus]